MAFTGFCEKGPFYWLRSSKVNIIPMNVLNAKPKY